MNIIYTLVISLGRMTLGTPIVRLSFITLEALSVSSNYIPPKPVFPLES
jgi:hypothetical protein